MGSNQNQKQSFQSACLRLTLVYVAGFLILGFLNGCAVIGLSLLGAGASAAAEKAVAHTLDGAAQRTFTVSLPQLRTAVLTGLNRMGFKVEGKEITSQGELIKASTTDRQIEIELEAISPKATRMRSVVRQGMFFKDRATATEIILQTEKLTNGA